MKIRLFGYVRAYKPNMTFSQFDIYKGIYCSLCKEIGKRYGLLARMTLSYDLAFFALLKFAVAQADCQIFLNCIGIRYAMMRERVFPGLT